MSIGITTINCRFRQRTSQDWIQSSCTFSEKELQAIAKELLGILAYLHHRQPPVIHRDLKPSNILLGNRSGNSVGQLYLIDFGSVQTVVHGGTRTIVGTYGYMPPEQFGGQTTPTSDLYALGATVIYLAVGQHPDQLSQREMRILFEERVNLNLCFIDWLKWLTEPSTDLRLKFAKQALDALEQSNSRLTIVAKPIGSKLEVTHTRQGLEILIPPQEPWFHLIGLLTWTPLWTSFVALITVLLAKSLAVEVVKNGMIVSLGTIATLLIVLIWPILFIFMLFCSDWHTLRGLFGQRLCITPQTVTRMYELFGVRFLRLPFAFTPDQQKITRVEYMGVYYASTTSTHGGRRTAASSPHINLWAANKKLTIGLDREDFTGETLLTDEEFRWLQDVLNSSRKSFMQKRRER